MIKSVSNLSLQIEGQNREKPTAAMVELLTVIWQRVLQQPCIGVDDNFFDLGGDSSVALRLIDEVMQTCCRELSPLMIYKAPTIRALAVLLEEPCTTLVSPLAVLKAGTAQNPIFFAHGFSGDANYFDLAGQTRTNHAIYGIRANLPRHPDQPFDRIEDMARHDVEVIKTIQPKGPYALIGYSFGGLVALEMSRCLLADGDKVALLALLDTYPHRRHLPLAQRLPLTLRRTKSHVHKIKQMPYGGALSYCVRGLHRRLHFLGLQTRFPADTRPNLCIEDRNYIAFREYRPQFYPGKIKFVRAEGNFFDPMKVWGGLVAQIDVETVPGDHLEILDRRYQNLSPLLSRYLEQALDQRSR